jgi:hypothetical protein
MADPPSLQGFTRFDRRSRESAAVAHQRRRTRSFPTVGSINGAGLDARLRGHDAEMQGFRALPLARGELRRAEHILALCIGDRALPLPVGEHRDAASTAGRAAISSCQRLTEG